VKKIAPGKGRPGPPESGSGLGLAIVHEVVTRHRGTITLAGTEHRPGLTARITLPLYSAGAT
jgi:signal transduction histidine kinase